MEIFLHQKNNNIGDLESSTKTLIKTYEDTTDKGLHLYPEIFLGGYPLQDVCLQRPFIEKYHECLEKLRQAAKKGASKTLIFGGLEYELNENQEIVHIYNSAYKMDRDGVVSIYRKQLLPNYDIYDEKKYFTAGKSNCFFEVQGYQFCLLICEDMWHSSAHSIDPVTNAFNEYVKNGKPIDAVINLSASPFHIGKQKTRIKRAKEIAHSFQVPFIYINQIGLHDEILFDGQSFIVNQEEIITAQSFQEETISFVVEKSTKTNLSEKIHQPSEAENTWENLFRARVNKKTKSFQLLNKHDLKEILLAQSFALNEYARKTKMTSFLVALSGGIDSALAVAIAHLASKASGLPLEAIYMPSQFNSNLSYDLSKKLCENIGIRLNMINLKFIHQTIKMTFNDGMSEELTGLADENIQSRLRGSLIYARSNQTGAMVLNTSNKSELSVGYSTLYGDSVGAISILGDLYKTEVYQLANFINQYFNNIIPEEIITRAPSAELREDQKDEDSLPPYERLDLILECLLSYQYSLEEIQALGIDQAELNKIFGLYNRAEFKRYQFCPIVKLKAKSFGFGHRNPILKNLSVR